MFISLEPRCGWFRIYLLVLWFAQSVGAIETCKQPCSARIMSINIANKTDARQIADEIRQRTGGVPDLLLMQEVPKKKGAPTSIAEDIAHLLDLQVVFAAPKPGPTSVGVAILSRWPLSNARSYKVPRFYKLLKFRPRIALAVTAHSPAGPIRIWTTHLDTRINVEERLNQLRPILEDARSHVGPAIIGGDLNTLSMGWLLHSVPYPSGDIHARAVTALMRTYGFETPFKTGQPTFDRFGLQLDWVFLRDLEAGPIGIEPLAFSDHHAIWTEFRPPAAVKPSAPASVGVKEQ
jgi:endonuclease/exonuclease/phosphatase family metal-dependent hydrolase